LNRKRIAAVVAACGVTAVGLTAFTGIASAHQTSSLTGAGSTFVVPLVTSWTQHYKGASVSYSGIGSGGGISAITARTVDFGASDAPLTPDQASACRGCAQIPWAFSATSIPYHVSGVGYGLKLTGPILAGIYMGAIKYWDNPAIKKINAGVKLPHEAIVPIFRSDGSGTSYNFTDYLSHVSKTWKSKIGKGTQPSFPTGVGARGSSGVAAKLTSTPGGITYVDVAYSLKNHFTIAKVQNRAGKFELPGLVQIKAAADSIHKVKNSQNAFTAVDPNAHAPKAYPICTFSWVIVPTKTGKAADLKKFIKWALGPGQSYGPKLLFVPVPTPVKAAGLKTLAKIHS
jgi:phosphate transport system substrate-binding protein